MPSEQELNPRIYVFGNDYHWRTAVEPIDDPNGQVDDVSLDMDVGSGPGMPFAVSLLKQNPDMIIGLIPCAKGNSSIEEWQKNLSDRTLYGSCLKRVKAATTMGKLAGLLIFQGEADTIDPTQHPVKAPTTYGYAEKFSTFVSHFREDVSQPNLPVVFAQIGTTTEPKTFAHWKVIKKEQEKIKLPCSAMIKTDDLALKDPVHFTTESYRIIGLRFAEALLKLTSTAQRCS